MSEIFGPAPHEAKAVITTTTPTITVFMFVIVSSINKQIYFRKWFSCIAPKTEKPPSASGLQGRLAYHRIFTMGSEQLIRHLQKTA